MQHNIVQQQQQQVRFTSVMLVKLRWFLDRQLQISDNGDYGW